MRRFVAPLLLLASLPGFAQITYDATNYPVADITTTQVADFNRDGRPDIAFSASDGIHLKRNTGAGVFGADVVSPGADGNLLAADVNGDGWPDLIDMEPNGSFTALLNHRDGTFTRGPRATLASEARGMVAGDLNLDGKVDLVENQGSKLRVFKGTGVGSFTSGVILSTANLIRDFELTDINGDGKLDLLVAEGNKLVIWPGLGDGTFGSPSFINDPATTPSQHPIVAVASGDFNNDGTPDIALSTANPCPNDPNHLCGDNTIFIYRNNGNATFTRVSSFHASLNSAHMRAADLNGDQNIDLLFFINGADTGTVDYVLGKGNGTFGTDFQIDQDTDVEIRDLDLDGRNDLVVTDAIFSNLNVKLARSGSINCAPPGSANLTAKICVPSTATAASPVVVRASGNSPLGVQRVEIWIDGKKAAQKLEDQIRKSFTLAPGTHRIAVVAVDKYLGASTTVKNVTVH